MTLREKIREELKRQNFWGEGHEVIVDSLLSLFSEELLKLKGKESHIISEKLEELGLRGTENAVNGYGLGRQDGYNQSTQEHNQKIEKLMEELK